MKFLVFVSLNLNKSILPPSLLTVQQIHYDAYCTTVKSVIQTSVQKYGPYRASLASLRVHLCECGGEDKMQVVPMLCPIRVAMCTQTAWARVDGNNRPNSCWRVESLNVLTKTSQHLGLNIGLPIETVVTSGMPVMDMTTHFANPWAAD
jgi:hypothetical protein